MKLVNNSSDTIVAGISFKYPDTSVTKVLARDWVIQLNPNGDRYNYDLRGGYAANGNTWEERLKNTPAGIVSVFFINIDTFLKYPVEALDTGKRILVRKDLDLEDLEKSNTVTYP